MVEGVVEFFVVVRDAKELYLKQVAHVIFSHRVSLDTIVTHAIETLSEDAETVILLIDELRELVPSSTISEYFKIVAQEVPLFGGALVECVLVGYSRAKKARRHLQRK